MTDWELLQRYLRNGDDDAFRELVQRHTDLVYSVCLRQLQNAQLAEDATQAVFIVLSRRANTVKPDAVLSSWLYGTARFVCTDIRRAETRRKQNEETARAMRQQAAPPADWEQLAPVLDEALGELREGERAALILRYFENKSLHELGVNLNISTDAAQKRVERALLRLKEVLLARGVTASETTLASVLVFAVHSAPAQLSQTSATVVLAAVHGMLHPPAAALADNCARTIFWGKAKLAGAVAVTLAGLMFGAMQLNPPAAQNAPAPALSAAARQPAVTVAAPPPAIERAEAVTTLTPVPFGNAVGGPKCAVMLPGGTQMLAGGLGAIRVLDATSGAELRRFARHGDLVVSLAVSADGKLVMSGNGRGLGQLWDAQTGKVLREFESVVNHGMRVSFSPDASRVLTASGTDLAIWNTDDATRLLSLQGHSGQITSAAFSRDGKWIVSSARDGTVRIWDSATGAERLLLQHHDEVLAAALSNDNRTLLSSGNECCARVWAIDAQMTSARETARLSRAERAVQHVALSPDGRLALAIVCPRITTELNDPTLHQMLVWSLTTNTIVHQYETAWRLEWAAFPSNGQILAAGDVVTIFNLPLTSNGNF